MNIDRFLRDNGFTAEPYDTTNSWGFAGSAGTQYIRGSIRVLKARAYFRHLPSHNFITLSVGEDRLLDLHAGEGAERKVMNAIKGLLEGSPA